MFLPPTATDGLAGKDKIRIHNLRVILNEAKTLGLGVEDVWADN